MRKPNLTPHIHIISPSPDMKNFIKPLDDIITQSFIPNLLDSIVTEQERRLYSLPIKKGGLGIPIISETCETQLENSMSISAPLKSVIVEQFETLPDPQTVKNIKIEKKTQKKKILKEKCEHIDQHLSPEMKKAVSGVQGRMPTSMLELPTQTPNHR